MLSDVEAERLVLTGDAKGYSVKVPDGGRIVGRFIVPEGISVGFEGEGADVTVVNAPKGDVKLTRLSVVFHGGNMVLCADLRS